MQLREIISLSITVDVHDYNWTFFIVISTEATTRKSQTTALTISNLDTHNVSEPTQMYFMN